MSLLDALGQGATVVTVGTRLARHLRWRFDSSRSAEGKPAWRSADVIPWSAWLERLYRSSLMDAGSMADVDLLTASQARLLWQDIMASRPAGLALTADQHGAVQAVLEAWQLMRTWQIPTDAIRKFSRSGDTDAFAAWAAEFEARCRAQGWIDPWSLPDRIAADLSAARFVPDNPVCFAGFDESIPQQAAIQSLTPTIPVKPDSFSGARVMQLRCETPEHERDLAARWARHMLEDGEARVIGVVVPDLAAQADAYRRTFLDIFDPDWRSRTAGDLPVNAALGQSLSDTGPVHIALLILRAASGRVDYRELGVLLRTPYLRDAAQESGSRAAMDIRIRERRQQEIDLRQFVQTAGTNDPPDFVAAMRGIVDWGDTQRKPLSTGQWAAAFGELLNGAGWLKGRELNSDEYQALKAWGKLIQSFSKAGRITGDLSRESASRLLHELAREQRFQPEGRMDGVQIMAPRDAAGHRFDGIWIAGLSSDVWPPAARPNPLIPFDLQASHGVPGATPQRVRDATVRLMGHLTAAAPVTLASWPAKREQETLVPSPLLPETTVNPDAIPRYSGDTHRACIFESRQLESLATDPAPPLAGEMTVHGGSRLLKFQAACPARAFFEFRLGAKELAIPAYGIDALQRGNMMHDALEFLYSDIRSLGRLSEIDNETMGQMIDRAIVRSLQKHISRRHPLSKTLSANEERRMRKLLVMLIDIDRARPAFEVEAVESDASVTLGTITLKLRQDRIDRFAEGQRLVLDYKTGARFSIGDWRGERPAEPQLPLYAATADVRGIAVVTLNQDGVKYAGVGSGEVAAAGLKTAAEFTRNEESDWASLVRDWARAMNDLADEFAAGDCRIDRINFKAAEGEFAMLTRVHAYPGADDR